MLCDTARVTRSVAARTSTRVCQRSRGDIADGSNVGIGPDAIPTRSVTSQATCPSSAGSPSGGRPGPSGALAASIVR